MLKCILYGLALVQLNHGNYTTAQKIQNQIVFCHIYYNFITSTHIMKYIKYGE